MRSTESECTIHGIRAIHDQTDPEVKAILTPAQHEPLQTIRQQEIQEMIEKKRAAQ
jgi:hypothetical protein